VMAELNTLQPAAIVTFGTGGISRHPDHIRASEVAVAAAREYISRRGSPLAVYGWAMPADIADELGKRLNRTYPVVPDERIVRVPVQPDWLAAQWRAVQHHKTQHSPPPWPLQVRIEVQAGYEFLERLIPDQPVEPEPLLAWLAG
jgi:N-acetylglucosamine malate deacetylase 2